MRNIFDQYSQPENRVTHALMTALNEDRVLLAAFLNELVLVKAPGNPHKLLVLEQRYPGESELSEEEFERRGIPDGWIYDEDGWCVFIESKVLAKLNLDQIRRHRRTAIRRGFQNVTAVAIVLNRALAIPQDIVLLEWRDIYAWLCGRRNSSMWAARTASYLEIAEARLIEAEQHLEGTLTKFAGFPFGQDHPFTYLEGKRVLNLAMSELRHRNDLRKSLGMDPTRSGRGAITGSQEKRVWDFLSLDLPSGTDSFTSQPHLTLSFGDESVDAVVTVPNAVNRRMRRRIVELGEHGFEQLIKAIVEALKLLLRDHKGAVPWFRGMQRRYPSQRAAPFIDARIEFDLRTVLAVDGGPKTQPRWMSAAYASFANKGGANYQIQMGVLFPCERCPELRRADAVDLIAAAWIGCKPLIDLAR